MDIVNDVDPLGIKPQEEPEALVMPKKVAVLYSDVKREYFPTEQAYMVEADADVYAGHTAMYLRKMGIEVEMFPGNELLAENLRMYKPDVAFNLIDSIRGDETLSSSVPGLLEMLNIPYTGAGVLGQALNTNKFTTYQLMQSAGIPVPNHQLITDPSDLIDPELRYPLFPKLNNMHSSVEIAEDSVCKNEKELRAKIKEMFNHYHQPILIDEFIAGIEVAVPVLDGLNTKVYPARRLFDGTKEDTSGGYKFMTFDRKWVSWQGMGFEKYEDAGDLKELAKEAFEVLKMSDYARFDVRIDASGRYHFIDANTNPFFGSPNESHSPFSMILDMYGVEFTDVLKRLLLNTVRDTKLKLKKFE